MTRSNKSNLPKTTDISDTSSSSSSSDSEAQSKYRTELCRNWVQGHCAFGSKCLFAHGIDKIREKTSEVKPCTQYLQRGYCLYGSRCQFSHPIINQNPKLHLPICRFI